MQIDPSSYVSAAEASAILKVTTGRVYQMVKSGELRSVKFGRALLIDRASLSERVKAAKSDFRSSLRE